MSHHTDACRIHPKSKMMSHHKDACRMMRYLMMSGAAVDFQSVFPLRPGLGSPSQGDFVAIASVLESLLSKAWETTRLSPDARLRVGSLMISQCGKSCCWILSCP